MALRVLAHFVPGDKVLDFVAAETDWLDIRWCADDDDAAFYRELPDAEVIWHVLRPLSGADLPRGARLRLVHKFGAGVNTIDVETATRLRHRGRQHARRQRAVGGRGNGAADAGRAAPPAGAGSRHPRRAAAGRPIRSWARRSATSAPAPSAWSATATSPNRSRASSPRWAPPWYTPAPATTAGPAGGRCRNCWPPATSSRCTYR